ncbi:MAG: FAD-dependent oxidoreductase, partial [Puniceicoccales bacterium]
QKIQAYHWIDCSETAALYQLVEPVNPIPKRPRLSTWRFAVQSEQWNLIEPDLKALTRETASELIDSAKPTERYIAWTDEGDAWERSLVQQLKWLRDEFSTDADLFVSHCGACAYPSYNSTVDTFHHTETHNLTVLSPATESGRAITTIEDRFVTGATARIPAPNRAIPSSREERQPAIPVHETILCDVLIAGTGTSGSIAAITSAENGAQTIAIDHATHPGGVGTGGGITGYFFGISGGIQTRVDQLTYEMTALLSGQVPDKDSWHQDAKKLAILQLFRQHQVHFSGNLMLCAVDKDQDRVTAIYAANENGLTRFQAKAYVDCTGDGDLCTHAGSSFTSGREGDGRNLAYSQAALALQHTDTGIKTGSLNYDAGWLDPTSSIDLTRARLTGIGLYAESDAHKSGKLLSISPILGIRQSRQIDTDYSLQLDDLISGREFEDSIGEAGCHADSHSVDFEFENDEMVFFYWACRLFRHPLRTQLPYRMMLPRGLANVWIACRASGMSTNAFYAIRMQRDMQRLGEIAGIAAAQSIQTPNGARSRDVNIETLRQHASTAESQLDPYGKISSEETDPLTSLQAGKSGTALWRIYQAPDAYTQDVVSLLESDSPNTSFYAACILAMWNHPKAEPRLLEAVQHHETGEINPEDNTGAYGQEIDIPFWLLAIVLLRRCGTRACIPTLETVINEPDSLLNVKTSIALTLERLHERQVLTDQEALTLTEILVNAPVPDQTHFPSRSLARALRKEPQIILPNKSGAEPQEDHTWQLHLIACRIQNAAGRPTPLADEYRNDPRIHVRNRFLPYMHPRSSAIPDTRAVETPC